MAEKMFSASPPALRQLVRECRECAGDRLTPGTPSELLTASADALEMYLTDIERARKASRSPKH